MEGAEGEFNYNGQRSPIAGVKRIPQKRDSSKSISAEPQKQKTRHRRVFLNSGARTREHSATY